MKQLIHAVLKEAGLLGRALIIAGLVVGGVAYANTFVQPSQNPPAGNVPAPVNIGNVAQAKSGNFAAAAIAGLWVQGTEGFCIGPNSATGGQRDCISAWPTGGGGGGGSVDIPSMCQLERTAVVYPDGAWSGNWSGYGDICNRNLSQASRNAGWVATGADACAEDRNTCTVDGVSCFYARITCQGVPLPATVTSYTPAQAINNGFYSGGSSGGGGGGGFLIDGIEGGDNLYLR